MAGKKRKAATASQASPENMPLSTRHSQRVRPSVEFVEISSDEAEECLPGAARGLNGGNILPPPSESVEQTGGNDNEATTNTNQVARRMTRGSRNGRADNSLNYDMMYHPMDEITRPKWAAQRHSGSRSLPASALRAEDGHTSDATLPSSARESDDTTGDEEGSAVEGIPARIPNPHATRHSTRAEAIKNVNYSRKHHPQDHGLPGHQHKAELLKRMERKQKKALGKRPSPKGQVPPQNEDAEDNVMACDADDEQDLAQEDSLGPQPTARPRKKLRVLDDDRSPSPRKSKKKGRRPAKSANQRSNFLPETYAGEDTTVYVDAALDGAGVEPASTNDDVEAAQNLNGLVDDAQAPSSSARNISSVLAAKQGRPIGGLDTFASDDEEDPQDFVDRIQSQDPSQEHDVEIASVYEDRNATKLDGNDDLLEEEDADELFTNGKDEVLGKTFLPQSLASIAAGAPRNHNSTSGRTGSASDNDVNKKDAPGRLSTLHPSKDQTSRSIQHDDGGDMGPPQSGTGSGVSASTQRSQENGISTRIAALTRASDRMESSSSTFKASTRAESSSSTFKASSRVSSRTQPPRSELDHADTIGDDGKGDVQSDSAPRATSEMEQDQALATDKNAVKAVLDDLLGSQRMTEAETTTDVRSVRLQSQAQPISPVASFKEGEMSKSVTPAISGQQSAIGSSVHSDEPRRSHAARESSRISYQSPEPTPRRMDNAPPFSQSQLSRGGDLLYSDPDDTPTEDGERTEDEEDSDQILPFLSTDTSSPSKLVDVV